MRIGVDVDEVLAEFVKGYFKMYEKKYAKQSPLFEEIFTYNLWEVLNITKEEAIKLVEEFYDSDDFGDLSVVGGAEKGLKELSDNEIFIITARPDRMKEKTNEFLDRYFSEINFNLIHSNDFFGGVGKSKSEICKELSVEIIIEDHREYALTCAEKGIKVLLIDKPWNQNVEHEDIIRVKNWKEVLERVKKIENDTN